MRFWNGRKNPFTCGVVSLNLVYGFARFFLLLRGRLGSRHLDAFDTKWRPPSPTRQAFAPRRGVVRILYSLVSLCGVLLCVSEWVSLCVCVTQNINKMAIEMLLVQFGELQSWDCCVVHCWRFDNFLLFLVRSPCLCVCVLTSKYALGCTKSRYGTTFCNKLGPQFWFHMVGAYTFLGFFLSRKTRL